MKTRNPDLELCWKALRGRAKGINLAYQYYYGRQPVPYATSKVRNAFNTTDILNYRQNWCAVVVDATLDRITLKGFDTPNEAKDEQIDAYFDSERLRLVSRDIHRDAVITGDAYLLLDRIDGVVKVFRNHPANVVVIYDDANPNEMRMAAKAYELDGKVHLNIYYPNKLDVYEATSDRPDEASAFMFVEERRHDFDRIPVIHFTADSDLPNVIPLQDAINKLFTDMMVVSEFNAFPQRWAVTNVDTSNLTASPQNIWRIFKGDSGEEATQVGEFQAGDIGVYLDSMDKLTNSIAVITRTPKHYFVPSGANVSGEALMVMETPLVKKVKQLHERFCAGWLELADLLVDDVKDVTVTWERPESEQIVTTVQSMKAMRDLGLPLETILTRFGWSKDEIENMRVDLMAEKKMQADTTAEALQLAQWRLQQANDPYNANMSMTDKGQAE